MPNSKGNPNRRVSEPEEKKIRRGRSAGRIIPKQNSLTIPKQDLPRTKALPELLSERNIPVQLASPKLTKLLLNVTIQRSLGAVQVVMSPEHTVGDLIAAVLVQYEKEGRRPGLPNSSDPLNFDLHYTQFTLQSLNREEKLIDLGSRNFFLCPKEEETEDNSCSTTSCCKEAEKVSLKSSIPWLKFIAYLF